MWMSGKSLPSQPASTAGGATAAGGGSRGEVRTPDQQTPKIQDTHRHINKQPNNKSGMKKREGWGGKCKKQGTK